MLNAILFVGGFLAVTLLIRMMILKDNRNVDHKDAGKAG